MKYRYFSAFYLLTEKISCSAELSMFLFLSLWPDCVQQVCGWAKTCRVCKCVANQSNAEFEGLCHGYAMLFNSGKQIFTLGL